MTHDEPQSRDDLSAALCAWARRTTSRARPLPTLATLSAPGTSQSTGQDFRHGDDHGVRPKSRTARLPSIGHDLIVGAGGRSAVGTPAKRTTRFVLFVHLANDHAAPTVETAMRRAIATLPSELMRSVTLDQGQEMARHRSISVATGVPIYFCDPYSPW